MGVLPKSKTLKIPEIVSGPIDYQPRYFLYEQRFNTFTNLGIIRMNSSHEKLDHKRPTHPQLCISAELQELRRIARRNGV